MTKKFHLFSLLTELIKKNKNYYDGRLICYRDKKKIKTKVTNIIENRINLKVTKEVNDAIDKITSKKIIKKIKKF